MAIARKTVRKTAIDQEIAGNYLLDVDNITVERRLASLEARGVPRCASTITREAAGFRFLRRCLNPGRHSAIHDGRHVKVCGMHLYSIIIRV